jgi:lipid II isoglutaminyl synthase (glutamine-hydrolysing)
VEAGGRVHTRLDDPHDAAPAPLGGRDSERRASFPLRHRLAVSAGRAAGFLARTSGMGAGQQIPGADTLALDPDALARLARGRVVCLVSATNGKTAVTALVTAALRANGVEVATNNAGANMLPGLASALGRDRAPSHAVLEVDEAALPAAIAATRPAVVVLGELSRDQLDRHHEVARLASMWRGAFATSDAHFVAPARDPNVTWALRGRDVSWVDLETHSDLDAEICLECGARLQHASATQGWCCDTCGRAARHPLAVQRDATLEIAGSMWQGPMALRGHWQYANRALAVVGASVLGIPISVAFAATSKVISVARRPRDLRTGSGRDARLVLVKNPAGWAALIEDLRHDPAAILFVQNDDAPDGRDPSWLWDVPYERLRPRRVIASGTRCLDVAVRIESAGLELLGIEADPRRALAEYEPPEGLIVAASYSAHAAFVRGPTGP